MIFVFGSNRQGIHGAGAALFAKRSLGAVQGCGEGLMGQSYALPSKLTPDTSLTLHEFKGHIERFMGFAVCNPLLDFKITRVGCGHAKFSDAEVAPLFLAISVRENCWFDNKWTPWLGLNARYWGTYRFY